MTSTRQTPDPEPSISTRWVRAALLLAAAALAAATSAEYLSWRSRLAAALGNLQASGLYADARELRRDMLAERDPLRAELRLARALLAEELDPRRFADMTPEEVVAARRRGRQRLADARRTAARVLERRHASWQAALVLGAATHLELLRDGDPRLTTEPEAWERPLVLARRLAPSQPEPPRHLAAAHLGSWSRLSPERRRELTRLLEVVFENRTSFDLLIERWLTVAPSLEASLAVIPSRPHQWSRVRRVFSNRRDWERMVLAHDRWYEAVYDDIDLRLAELESGRHGRERATAEMSKIARTLPRDRRSAPRLERLLDLADRGPRRPALPTLPFRSWLEWFVDQCLIERCHEPSAIVPRLVRLSGELPPHLTATAALLASADTPTVHDFSRMSAASPWGPYAILAAQRGFAAGDLVTSRTYLDAVPGAWRGSPLFLRTRFRLAEAGGDPEETAAWASRLARLSADLRPGVDWIAQDGSWRLPLVAASVGGRLEISIDGAEPAGAPIGLRWDGEIVDWRSVTPNDIIRLDLDYEPGLHRLELLPLSRHRITPGPVRLSGREGS